MPAGKFPGRNPGDERNPERDESLNPLPIIDNPEAANFYTARQVSRWIGVSPTRVRQLSLSYNLGKKTEKNWHYTLSDIMLLGKATRKGKQPMRNVTPPDDPDLLLKQLQGQDELKRVMRAHWEKLTGDLRMFMSDVSGGLFHRLEKFQQKIDRWQFDQEHALLYWEKDIRATQAAVIGRLAQEVADLRKEIEKMKEPRRRRKEERGRGVLVLGGAAPSTLANHEANAA